MKTVVAYLGGVPPSQKLSHKTEILHKFVNGVNAGGDRGIAYQGHQVINSNVAVIQGWVHEGSGNAKHLTLRKNVIETQNKLKKKTIIIDSNLFNYKDKNHPTHYSRYSANGVFPTTGNYFWDNPDPSRWKQISKDLGISLKEWRNNGDHILICTQRNGGWSMKGVGVVHWLDSVVEQIRKYSDRKIIVRGHPGDKQAPVYLKKDNLHYTVSSNLSILDDFKNAWAVVTYNSSPGVAASIEGIPAFITDPDPRISQAYDVGNYDISKIESPVFKDREKWVEKISMCHWKISELEDGTAWRHIRNYV